jgi:hypothetical protein
VRVPVKVRVVDEILSSRNVFAAVMVGVPEMISVDDASDGVKTVGG